MKTFKLVYTWYEGEDASSLKEKGSLTMVSGLEGIETTGKNFPSVLSLFTWVYRKLRDLGFAGYSSSDQKIKDTEDTIHALNTPSN